MNEGELLTFTVSGADRESPAVTFGVGQLPTGAVFDASTRRFSWVPGFGQSGHYEITFTVSDGSLTDGETVAVTVNDVNRAPIAGTADYWSGLLRLQVAF